MVGRPALRNLTNTLHQQRGTASPQTPLDERSWAPHSDWLRAASLATAPFPGCSCQTQASVRIYSRCPEEKTPPCIAPSDFNSATKETLWVWMSVVSPGVFWTCLKSVERMVVFWGQKAEQHLRASLDDEGITSSPSCYSEGRHGLMCEFRWYKTIETANFSSSVRFFPWRCTSRLLLRREKLIRDS